MSRFLNIFVSVAWSGRHYRFRFSVQAPDMFLVGNITRVAPPVNKNMVPSSPLTACLLVADCTVSNWCQTCFCGMAPSLPLYLDLIVPILPRLLPISPKHFFIVRQGGHKSQNGLGDALFIIHSQSGLTSTSVVVLKIGLGLEVTVFFFFVFFCVFTFI